MYELKHTAGMTLVYKNNTKSKKMIEEIMFDMAGLQLRDFDGQNLADDRFHDLSKTVKFEIGPGEEKFIQLEQVEKSWRIQSSVSYELQEVGVKEDVEI